MRRIHVRGRGLLGNVGVWHEGGVGYRVVLRLAILAPLVQFAGVGVNRGLFLVLVTMNGKVFGFLPALYGADFAVEIVGNLFPGIEFFTVKARPFEPFGIDRCSTSRHEGRLGWAFQWPDYISKVYRIGKESETGPLQL